MTKPSFKQWLIHEYKTPDLLGHPSWVLALEIEAKYPDFPLTGSYMDLAVWLSDHGACRKCLKAFKDAWDNYVND